MKFLHIGDVLLITPTIRALHEFFPKAELVVLVNQGTEEMLQGNPLINEIMVYHRRKGCGPVERLKTEIDLLKRIRNNPFDLTVDLTGGDRPAFLGFLSGARIRVGPHPEGKGMLGKKWLYTHAGVKRNHTQHMVEQNLDIVRQIGIQPSKLNLEFFLSNEEEKFALDFFDGNGVRKEDLKIHVHPTSRWLFKCWRDDYFADLINRLVAEFQAQVVLTCSPDPKELAKVKKITDRVHEKTLNLIGRITLRELASISKASDLFIGVDSAPMHLAAAVGTPTIALFGPTGDYNWHPWCVTHKVLKRNEGCVSTGPQGCTVTKRCFCLEKITGNEVLDAVRGIFSNQSPSFSKKF
ncbi:MAG TPA: putative lipopolysaccharide heptosyltransferase III [Nitrospiria bacterium]